jgi:type I restriction enzyme S subunit
MHELLTKGIGHTEFKQTCLGKIPTDWEIYHLPEVASYQNGKAFPSEEYGEYGVHLLRPGNMHEDGSLCWDKARTICLPERWVDLASDYVVQENELVMNLTAQSLEDEFLGRVCLTQEGTFCLLNQRIARIRDRNCHLPFLFWCLKGSYIRAQIDSISNGMKVKHIYNSNLNALKLPVPTSLDEQETIAKILSNQQKIIGAAQRHCKNLSLLKHQLVNGSLSGQCDEIYTKLRRELVGV